MIEVADTSLRKDRTVKAALCASHGIPEYLILDERGEFTPLGAGAPIRVADLLPDPEDSELAHDPRDRPG